jgi:hypothetical protein
VSPHLNASLPPGQDGGPIDVRPPADIPDSCHRAYCYGLDASRNGVDLATVIYDAAMSWPLADVHAWCELVACASLGYWTGEGGGA